MDIQICIFDTDRAVINNGIIFSIYVTNIQIILLKLEFITMMSKLEIKLSKSLFEIQKIPSFTSLYQ